MGTEDASFTRTGLTLQQAEQRIHELEAAAVKAALLAAEVAINAKEQLEVGQLTGKLVSCVDLLFTELKVEGMKHSQFVESSLGRVSEALKQLQAGLAKQRKAVL